MSAVQADKKTMPQEGSPHMKNQTSCNINIDSAIYKLQKDQKFNNSHSSLRVYLGNIN